MKPSDNPFEIINRGNGGADASPAYFVCVISCPNEGAGCSALRPDAPCIFNPNLCTTINGPTI